MTDDSLKRRMRAAATVVVLAMAGQGLAAGETMIEVIKARMVESWTHRANAQRAEDSLKSLRDDGTWADVDYADRTRGGWKPDGHLRRMSAMAEAAAGKGEQANIAAMRAGVIKALDAWIKKDPMGDNWWNNQIGTPYEVGRTALLMEKNLSAEEMAGVIKILTRAKVGMTGQNLVWLSRNTVIRGLLERDEKLVRVTLNRVWDEVRDDAAEGIQPDASFHQHGAQLYTGGYGVGFLDDTTAMMALAVGTPAAAEAKKVKIMERYLLDGYQWMIYGGTMDSAARGREISRPQGDANAGMGAAAGRLLTLTSERGGELKAAVSRATGGVGEMDAALVGNRHFWASDFMVQRRAGWYASVKMVSNRTLGTESGNGENLKSHGQLFGTAIVMRRGDEYRNIAPVWDWTRLPGATMEAGGMFPKHEWGKEAKGATAFVGGVSDGRVGAAAFDLARDGVKARKFWVMGEDVIVALGAGVEGTGKFPLRTSLNQCWLKGNVILQAESRLVTMKPETTESGKLTWAMHDQMGYAFLGGGRVVVSDRTQKGSWRNINDHGTKDVIERPVFSAWIEHGGERTFAYAVFPGTRPDVIEGQIKGIRVIANTPAAQCVALEGMTAAAFYEAGTLGEGDEAITVDRPCLVMIRRQGPSTTVTVSNPLAKEATVRVKAAGVDVQVTLPGGAMGGSSASVSMK